MVNLFRYGAFMTAGRVGLAADLDGKPRGFQNGQAAAIHLGKRVAHRDDDPRDLRAARIASVHGGVLPKWQHGSSVTNKRCPTSRITRLLKRVDFRVGTAKTLVVADTGELTIADDDAADDRVRLNPTAALGGLDQSVAHPTDVLVLQDVASPAFCLDFD